jgi:hypothetical protein
MDVLQFFTTYRDLLTFGSGCVAALLGASAFAWSRAYFDTKGKNLATRQDLEQLQEQLSSNTAMVKRIDQSFSKEDYLWRSELAFREQQLSELYGPAYGYLKSQTDIYELWHLRRQMDEVNFEVKQLFAKQNRALRDLIITKTHLIEGAQMPDSFVRFFSSTIIFDLYAAPTPDGTVPDRLAQQPRVKFPDDFSTHIFSTTERLKERLANLRTEHTIETTLGSQTRPGG